MSCIRLRIYALALTLCMVISRGQAQDPLPFGLCKALKQYLPGIPSGEYTIRGNQGFGTRVYCEYLGSRGYTYLPRSQFQSFSPVETKVVNIKHLRANTMQYDVTMKQISSHSNLSLIIQSNSYNGFKRPVNHDKLSRYIYLGFIPANLANSNTIQGYNVNNNDYKFLNCDKNPNSYLVFYYNDFHRYPAGYYKRCCYSKLMGQWIDQSKPTKSYLPQDYFFQTEMHMGGCGGYAVSGYKNQANIVGAALGFPFDL